MTNSCTESGEKIVGGCGGAFISGFGLRRNGLGTTTRSVDRTLGSCGVGLEDTAAQEIHNWATEHRCLSQVYPFLCGSFFCD